MADVQTVKRQLLEAAVIKAAMALSEYVGGGGFCLPAIRSSPQNYVAFGTKESMQRCIERVPK